MVNFDIMYNNDQLPSSIHPFPPTVQLDFEHNYSVCQVERNEYDLAEITELNPNSAAFEDHVDYKIAYYIIKPLDSNAFKFRFVKVDSERITGYPSGIISTNNPDIVLIIFDGDGQFVNVKSMQPTRVSGITPIISAYCLQTKGLLVLNDFIRVAAFNEDKEIWNTDDILRDGLKINRIDSNWIYGYGDDKLFPDLTPFKSDEFKIKIENGNYYGGGDYISNNANKLGEL